MMKRNYEANRTRKVLALAVAFLLMAGSLIAFAEPGTVVTDGGRLNMRKSADEKARIVTKIKNNATVEVLDHTDGWYHIRFDGQEGYVKEQFIKLLSDAVGKEIYSNGDTLYLREAPDDSSAIVGMVNSQGAITVEQIDDQWALVSASNTRGYVQVSQINELNDAPVEAAKQKWEEGILQKETKLYKSPDNKSEVTSTWPKGTGVLVSTYNKKWCMIQVSDEQAFGFAPASSVKLSPLPKAEIENVPDESEYTISASGAKKTAEKALKSYSGFKASAYTCIQDKMLSCDGIKGPLYRFAYLNKKGQMIYVAYVHCITGELLYKGDYSGFQYDKDIADLRTASPTTAPRTGYVIIKGDVVWDPDVVTSTPIPGNDIGESSARSIADRYLRAHYPRFSEAAFSRVECQHVTDDPMIAGGFKAPWYFVLYYAEDEYIVEGQLQYAIEINAYTGEINNCSGPGEGNG